MKKKLKNFIFMSIFPIMFFALLMTFGIGTLANNFASAEVSTGGGFYVGSNSSFTLNTDQSMTGFSVTDSGGGFYNKGTLSIDGGNVYRNKTTSSTGKGGGIYNNSDLIITAGAISENSATYGSAIYNTGTVTMDGGTISGNSGDNGSVYQAGGTFTMNDGTISQNRTVSENAVAGSGVFVAGGTFVMNNGTISRNQGASVFVEAGEFIMNNGTIDDASTETKTVYVSANGGTFTMNNGYVSSIYSDGTLSLNGGLVRNITANVLNTKMAVTIAGTITLGVASDSSIVLQDYNGTTPSYNIVIPTGRTAGTIMTFVGSSVEPDLSRLSVSGFDSSHYSLSTAKDDSGNWVIKFSNATYSISFNGNGGTSSVSSKNYEYGQTLGSLPTATRTGYTLSGWFTASSGGTQVSSTTVVSGTATYYAQWTNNTYTITLNANGGTITYLAIASGSDGLTIAQTGSKLTATYAKVGIFDCSITKTGYTFNGWTNSGSGTIENKKTLPNENPKTSVSNLTTTANGNVTLTAKWSANTYTITWDPNGDGATSTVTSSSKTYGSTLGTLPTATRNGFTFNGWFTSASGGTQVSSETIVTGNAQYYAQWTEVTSEVTRVEENGYSYVYFGSYPQTIKASGVSIYTDDVDERGYYLGSDGERYAKFTANPYNSSYVFSDGTTIVSGTDYYFKVEPIKWRILSEDNGQAIILAELILDAMWYDDDDSYSNNYAQSEIRAFLNGYSTSYGSSYLNKGFLQCAFTESEQEYIQTTLVDNSASTTNNTSNSYACENTNDKVWLLSYRDMINTDYGFNGSTSNYDTMRRKQTSDYSRANYVYYNTSTNYIYNGAWWSRSPDSSDSYYAWVSDYYGYVNYHYVCNAGRGVVPALTISL